MNNSILVSELPVETALHSPTVQARAASCIFAHECADCRRVARFKVGQNLFRARDNKVLGAEWRYITRSWFSEIQLFPGLGSIARYRYIIQFNVNAYKYILIHPNTSKYIQIHSNSCKYIQKHANALRSDVQQRLVLHACHPV